jgi:hypothetical protein
MDVTAFGSRFDTTRGNLNLLVGGGKQEEGKPPPGGAIVTTAGATWDLHVGKDRYENIDGPWETTTKARVVTDIAGPWVTFVGQEAKISASSLIVQASDKISLRVGDSRIVITPASIFFQAAMVRENQGGPIERVADAEVTEALDAAQADPGEPPDFLAKLPKGGGGGRRKHTAHAKVALGVFRGPDKKIHVGSPGSPGAITIDDSDPDFADRVANDLNRMAHTPEGLARFKAVNENRSKPVEIRKPDGGTGAPTAAFATSNPADATQPGEPTGRFDQDGNMERGTGAGTGGGVIYDPKDWPRPGEPGSPGSAEKLDQLLDTAQQSQNGKLPSGSFSGTVPPSAPPPKPPPPEAQPADAGDGTGEPAAPPHPLQTGS